MKRALLFISIVLSLKTLNAAIVDGESDSFIGFNPIEFQQDMSRSRLPETWQFYIGLGIGAAGFSDSAAVDAFSAVSGRAIPYTLSVSLYHPRSAPGYLHWGYSIDAVIYKKSTSFLVGSESSQLDQGIFGGGLLYYFTKERKTYARASLGIGTGSLTHTSEIFGASSEVREFEFSNGLGGLLEIGSTFDLLAFPNIFTYSLSYMSVTARDPYSGNTLSSDTFGAKVGVLY
jgi:hypothetical protein